MIFLAIALLLALVECTMAVGFDQSTAARGVLMCNNQPAVGVKIKLYDDDTGPDLDDWMGETTTDTQGRFQISGYTDETMTIDPKINIYHDCDDGIMPCQRRITIYIPDKYVTSGQIPRTTYDAGTIQLAGEFSGEERDCVNRRR